MAEGSDGDELEPLEGLSLGPLHGATATNRRRPAPTLTTLVLPEATEPLVSVVMVTHGGGETALGAIEALIENTERRSSSSSSTTPPPTARPRCSRSVSSAPRSSRTRTTSGSRPPRIRAPRSRPAAISASSTRTRSSSRAGCRRSSKPSSATSRSAPRSRSSSIRTAGSRRPARPWTRTAPRSRSGTAAIRARSSTLPAYDRLRLRRLPPRAHRSLPRGRRLRPGLHAGVLRGRRSVLQAPGARASRRSTSLRHASSMSAAAGADRRAGS